jgi:hypothetical protein
MGKAPSLSVVTGLSEILRDHTTHTAEARGWMRAD